jgi:DNA helicase II / ATP-dependent DNA helicase PcrA
MADTIKLTPEQQEAIAEINRNLQIIACAGSGKTEVITRRIANILQNKPGISPENIVAFTFTEKAAASMKSRIAKTLGEQSSLNINRMYIGTIVSGALYSVARRYCRILRTLVVFSRSASMTKRMCSISSFKN